MSRDLRHLSVNDGGIVIRRNGRWEGLEPPTASGYTLTSDISQPGVAKWSDQNVLARELYHFSSGGGWPGTVSTTTLFFHEAYPISSLSMPTYSGVYPGVNSWLMSRHWRDLAAQGLALYARLHVQVQNPNATANTAAREVSIWWASGVPLSSGNTNTVTGSAIAIPSGEALAQYNGKVYSSSWFAVPSQMYSGNFFLWVKASVGSGSAAAYHARAKVEVVALPAGASAPPY